MKNPYLLPICFAAATHGALLFGFTKSPRPAKLPVDERFICVLPIPPPPDEPVEVEAEPANSAPPKEKVAPPVSRADEPLVVDVADRITIDLPPLPPVGPVDVTSTTAIAIEAAGEGGTAPWRNGILPSTALDGPPQVRFQAAPIYPPEARRTGAKGEVLVEFIVDETGRVIDPRVVRASSAMFEAPTLQAVARWRFEPGKSHGRIVRFRMAVPVLFSLHEGW